MSVKSAYELQKLREIGKIVRQTLDETAKHVRPGITTLELDAVARKVLETNGAASAPPIVYGFPGALCISVNEEAIHGIPSGRVLSDGDLVKLDCVAVKDGYYADAAITVAAGSAGPTQLALTHCAERAFQAALRIVRAGARICEIGRAVEQTARREGFRVFRELCGHGVGREIHEEPQIPNYYEANNRQRLTEGLVITIEPILAAGSAIPVLARDGWTIRSSDGALAAHYEHTLMVTRQGAILITA